MHSKDKTKKNKDVLHFLCSLNICYTTNIDILKLYILTFIGYRRNKDFL